MTAYHLFEFVILLAFLLYSLRQILPLIPGGVASATRLAQAWRIPAVLLLPARLAKGEQDGCSSCSQCSGCAPKDTNQASVITLHRTMDSPNKPQQ